MMGYNHWKFFFPNDIGDLALRLRTRRSILLKIPSKVDDKLLKLKFWKVQIYNPLSDEENSIQIGQSKQNWFSVYEKLNL